MIRKVTWNKDNRKAKIKPLEEVKKETAKQTPFIYLTVNDKGNMKSIQRFFRNESDKEKFLQVLNNLVTDFEEVMG